MKKITIKDEDDFSTKFIFRTFLPKVLDCIKVEKEAKEIAENPKHNFQKNFVPACTKFLKGGKISKRDAFCIYIGVRCLQGATKYTKNTSFLILHADQWAYDFNIVDDIKKAVGIN